MKYGKDKVIPLPKLPGRSRQNIHARISRVKDDMSITREQWAAMRPDNARTVVDNETFHDAWGDSSTGGQMKKLRDSASATSTIMGALDMLGKTR
jgi:hypothetical protein